MNLKIKSLHNKRVIVHFGPPKTGTSAIQKWMLANDALLLEHGIYYPQHSIDANGISSGHVWNICTKVDDVVELQVDKLNQLLADFSTSRANTLVLSSEFFFSQLELLSRLLPEATFVGYIRNPLELLESNYSQSVKRHNNADKMAIPHNLPQFSLKSILALVAEKQLNLSLRAYLPSTFENGDIVNDFLKAIGAELVAEPTSYTNRSYAFEAVEFKRWFNGLHTEQYSTRLDLLLQRYSQNESEYTLIPRDKYITYKKQSIAYVNRLLDLSNVYNGQKLINSIRTSDAKAYLTQVVTAKQLQPLLDYIFIHEPLFFERICLVIRQKKHMPNYYSDITKQVLSTETILMKIRNIFKLLLLQFYKNDSVQCSEIGESEKIKGISQFRRSAKVPDDIAQALIYRDLAILAEKNNQLEWAYELMSEAYRLRKGPLIRSKLAVYAKALSQKKESE